MEATASRRFSLLHTFLPSSFLSPLSQLPLTPTPPSFSSSSFLSLKLAIPSPHQSLKSPLYSSTAHSAFQLRCSGEEVAVLEKPNETQDGNVKRKLYVVNLPWSFSVDDLKNAFSECGTVRDVELIKNKDGKNRGYAFVTMASGEEAQAVIDKFNFKELSGRTIRVEFARRLKKPRPQPPAAIPVTETQHKLYVSNLQWKVRSSHLREFFSTDFNPVSARVVFENASGRSAGYGFVSFGTREDAEAAMSALDGKELMGRPIRLKFSERNTEEGEDGEKAEEQAAEVDESVTESSEEIVTDEQPENS